MMHRFTIRRLFCYLFKNIRQNEIKSRHSYLKRYKLNVNKQICKRRRQSCFPWRQTSAHWYGDAVGHNLKMLQNICILKK